MPASLPYVFEDRTGLSTFSDWDELYDRLYLRVAQSHKSPSTINIYTMSQRASRHRDSIPFERTPSVILDFSNNSSDIGTASFVQRNGTVAIVPLNRYLRKTSLFSGSLSRKFTASDGCEYRWTYRGNLPGREWTCTTADNNYVVAHFDLKPPNTRSYGVSGNALTIYEQFSPLSLEFLTSLTIMRYIAEHNL